MRINGTDLNIYLDEQLVALSTDCTLDISSSFLGRTGAGEGYFTQRIASILDWTVSFSGLIDYSEDGNVKSIEEYILERKRFKLVFKDVNDSNLYFYTGYAYLENLSREAGNEAVVSYSANAVSDGILERFPFASIPLTVTTASSLVRNYIAQTSNGDIFVSQGDTTVGVRRIRSGVLTDFPAINVVSGMDANGNTVLINNESGSQQYEFVNLQFSRLGDDGYDSNHFFWYNGSIYASFVRYILSLDANLGQNTAYDLGLGKQAASFVVNNYGIFVIQVTDTRLEKFTFAGTLSTVQDTAGYTYRDIATDGEYTFVLAQNSGDNQPRLAIFQDTTLISTTTIGSAQDTAVRIRYKDGKIYVMTTSILYIYEWNKFNTEDATLLATKEYTNTVIDFIITAGGAIGLLKSNGITFYYE